MLVTTMRGYASVFYPSLGIVGEPIPYDIERYLPEILK
jgi:hypothetical protein